MTDWHLIIRIIWRCRVRAADGRGHRRRARGRTSPRDLALCSDDTEAALAPTLVGVRRWSDMPIAIELAHVGCKASTGSCLSPRG